MTDNRYDFCVKLADVPFRVICRNEKNRSFFREYFTDDIPLFCCEINDEDIRKEEQNLEDIARKGTRISYADPSYSLENSAIHRKIADELIRCGVILMHGSALGYNGEAVIFSAASGTGKSTHTGIWRKVYGSEVTMIDDDKPFLKKEGDIYQVYGTPWNGKHHIGSNIHMPLKAVVQLTRGQENSIVPMTKIQAFQLLLRQVYQPEDRELMKLVINECNDIVNTAAFHLLACNMEDEAAETAMKGIFL